MELRPATMDDAQRLFDWRNDPETREQSVNTDPVEWEDHVAWLGTVLADPERSLWIGVNGEPVGTMRLDFKDGQAEVSITVAPSHRGNGYAAALYRLGVSRAKVPVTAIVRGRNIRSQRAIRSAGFVSTGTREAFILYAYP